MMVWLVVWGGRRGGEERRGGKRGGEGVGDTDLKLSRGRGRSC